jgi:hypothetical protein
VAATTLGPGMPDALADEQSREIRVDQDLWRLLVLHGSIIGFSVRFGSTNQEVP